jgi:hypothetical protein
MVEFVEEKPRHQCRNPKCRLKLQAPVTNQREAFCCRGCYSSFYRIRCRICEEPIKQPGRGTRLVCKKPKCRSAWQRKDGMGRYVASSDAKAIQEVPADQSVLRGPKPLDPADGPWRQIAGPPLTPSQFHCATLGGRAMREVKRLEAKNRTTMKAAEQAEVRANGDFTEPDWQEAVSPDGLRCYVTRSRPAATKAQIAAASAIPDDLSIPAFLDRRKAEAELELRMAA